jgi:hypothetical protein
MGLYVFFYKSWIYLSKEICEKKGKPRGRRDAVRFQVWSPSP